MVLFLFTFLASAHADISYTQLNSSGYPVSSYFFEDRVIVQTFATTEAYDISTGKRLFRFESDTQPHFYRSGSNFCDKYFVGPGVEAFFEGAGVRLYDIRTGQFLKKFLSTIESREGFPSAISFSKDCTKLLVSGTAEPYGKNTEWLSYTIVWDIATEEKLFSINEVGSSMLNSEGTQLIFVGKSLKLYSVESGKVLYEYQNDDLSLSEARFTNDSSRIIFGGIQYSTSKNIVFSYDLTKKEIIKTFDFERFARNLTPLTNDIVYVAIDPGYFYRINLSTGEFQKSEQHLDKIINDIAISKDGSTVAACDTEGRATIWSTQTHELLYEIQAPTNFEWTKCSLSPNGDMLIFGLGNATRLYKLKIK